jgi:poly(A) polymerase
VSTFRSLKDGHTSNTFGNIEDDVLRRDFTLNALFYDPGQQVVVDYIGGMKDIREKRVRPIIPLSVIFSDDPVRMIRAVKYAAAAGFSLPATLKWKIKKQSHLLSSVPPSRLTEEIFKIINSPKTSVIVEALDRMGLYAYLQPNAARLMRENSGFRSRYLRSMAALNRESSANEAVSAERGGAEREGRFLTEKAKNLPGEAMGALIFDYLDDIIDWERGIAENYKSAFVAARSFVLPMNPPRYELGYAVRRFFSAHGITVKRAHIVDQPQPGENAAANSHPLEAKPCKRRHRRKKAESR